LWAGFGHEVRADWRLSTVLVGIHARVGFLEQRFDIPSRVAEFGAPDTEPETGWKGPPLHRHSEPCLELRALGCRVALGAGHERHELIAAPAEDIVGASHMTLEQADDMLHETVAHGVSHIVVDRLESIHIDEDQRERDVVPGVPLHLAVEELVKGHPVSGSVMATR